MTSAAPPKRSSVGRFAVSGVLGAGAFGTVYLGVDPDTGSPVAVKVLDRAGGGTAMRDRVHAEADALRRVGGDNCVRVRAVVEEPDVLAIVTDLIDGAPLSAVVRRPVD